MPHVAPSAPRGAIRTTFPRRFVDLSLRWKLTALMMVTTLAALLLSSALLIGHEYVTARPTLERELASTADMVGATSTGALAFGDHQAALENLRALAVDPRVLDGRILDGDRRVFASWTRETPAALSPTVSVERPVVLGADTIGAIVLTGDLRLAYARMTTYAQVLGVVLFATLGGALLLSLRLQRSVSAPILRLADEASRLAATTDYSVRVERLGADEIGVLYDRFNHMLDQIAQRDGELQRAHAMLQGAHVELETRVRERTRELRLEIAERTRAQGQLVAARDAAEAASRAKSAFLANMSHELRTPLNAIIGYSQMLMEDAIDTDRAAYNDLRRIEHAGQHLLHLINDVLDLSKIEAGRLTLQPIVVEARDLLTEVINTSRPLVERNGNRLVVEGIDRVGRFEADPMRVGQILLNLLSNGGKFTENGEVTLRASRTGTGAHDRVVFDVIDTGIGMSPDQVARIFLEFSQADPSTTRKYGGTGLGLAISERLCHAMGGTITVTSALGRGSTFTLTLPARAVAAAPAASSVDAEGTDLSDVSAACG